MANDETVKCPDCKIDLARVGKQGGVYPLPEVRVAIESGRVRLQCPGCGRRVWHVIAKAA